MKKLFLFILVVIIIIAGAGYIYLTYYAKNQKEKIFKLEKSIDKLKAEHIPIRFKILDNENEMIKVAIKYYDADGNTIKKSEQSMDGQELSFDFIVIPVKDKYVAFPNKIYTNKIAPKDGINILAEYDSIGFPRIFFSQDLDVNSKEALTFLYKNIKKGNIDSIQNHFGNMVHDFKNLKSFKVKQIYKIVTRTKGGIEVIEE